MSYPVGLPNEDTLAEDLLAAARELGQCPAPGCAAVRGHSGECPYVLGLTRRPSSRRPTTCPYCGSTYVQKFNGGNPVWLCDCLPCVVCGDADGSVVYRPVTRRSHALLCARCGEDNLALDALAKEADGYGPE